MKIDRLSFWYKRFLTDIKENRDLTVIPEQHAELGKYYIFFREESINSRGGNKPLHFDDRGIPLVHTYIDVEEDSGYYYYPITIGQYALAVFHSWISGRQTEKKEHFLRIADWFMESGVEDAKLGTHWLSQTPKPEYKLFGEWKSAFAQSRAISVLLRAWQITGSDRYLKTAESALIPFSIDIRDGGVTAHHHDGRPFYEEYVASEPTMVLDGHMFALFGLFDFIRAVPAENKSAEHARSLFQAGVESLMHWLPVFDLGYWLRFNYCRMDHYPVVDPCTIGYLRLVYTQLHILSEITGNQEIALFEDKFHSYDKPVNYLRMYKLKFSALKRLNRI